MSWSPLALTRYVLSGMLMGVAEIIPGVSGGTVALIVAVYERLVRALSTLVSVGLAVLRADLQAVRTHVSTVPWGLIVPLLLGMLVTIWAGARVIPGLMAEYPAQMRGLFLGLVAASLLIPALRIQRLTVARIGLGIGCAAAAFVLSGLPASEAYAPSLWRVFGSAAVAICAMILPGVSGAFLLEAMGMYTPTLDALNTLQISYVATFVLGAAVGLGTFAKLLDWLLARRHDATMAALVGLIVGALRALWPYGGAERALRLPGPEEPVMPVIALTLAGLGTVLGLVWWGGSRLHPEKM